MTYLKFNWFIRKFCFFSDNEFRWDLKVSGFDFDAGDLAITSSSTIGGDAILTLRCIPSSGKLTRLSLRVFLDSALLIKVSLCF